MIEPAERDMGIYQSHRCRSISRSLCALPLSGTREKVHVHQHLYKVCTTLSLYVNNRFFEILVVPYACE